MTSTQHTPNGNGTQHQSEVQINSISLDTQKYIKITEEQLGDRQDQPQDNYQRRIQAVLNKLREFVSKEGEQADQELQEAVYCEVAKLIVALQKIENLLIRKDPKQQAKRKKLKGLVEDVDIALDALNQAKPKIELARRILRLCDRLPRWLQ